MKKCLAFHGPLLYEAKVLRSWDPQTRQLSALPADTDDDDTPAVPSELQSDPAYFIHYQGWKATWDEWVGSDRIREYTPENLALKKQLVQEARDAKDVKKAKRAPSPNTASAGNGVTKKTAGRGRNSGSSTSASSVLDGGNAHDSGDHSFAAQRQSAIQRNLPKVTLHVPMQLKAVLVDDWEQVTKNKRIVKLPPQTPRISVSAILQRYRAKTLSDANVTLVEQSLLDEYLQGLREYFDVALPRLLLYRLERLQLSQLSESAKDSDMCSLYSGVHLLRLLSVLPELVSETTMGAQDCRVLVKQSESLLLWLAVNREALFPSSLGTASDKDAGNGESTVSDADALDSDGDGYYVSTSSQYEGVAIGM